MKSERKWFYFVALMVLFIPCAWMPHSAGAAYVGDGTVLNGTYGDWDIIDYGVCVTGVKSDGTMVIDSTKTSRPDCLAVTFPNDASLTSQAACIGDSDANGGSHYWANTCVANDGTRISLKDLDRTAANCDKRAKALGKASGTLTSKCTGSWVYTGPAGDGAPGFCYTRVELTGAGYTSTTCPTSTPGYVWDTTHLNCDFSYGTAGYVDANIMKKNGTAGPVRGTYVDLTGYTQGQCLAAGLSWSTGTTKSGSASVATTPQASTVAVVTGTRAGCLECHNSVSQNNSYAERWKETYLKTGHKNMLRKVTPGKNHAGPDGSIYTAAAGGQTIDFASGTVTGPYGTKSLMYIFGDWMAAPPEGLDVVADMGGGVAKYNGTSSYSCTPCHTTGWSNSTAGLCTLSSKTTKTACEGAGGIWTPSTGVQGTTGPEPLASFPSYTSGISGTWDKDGILCSRCHASTFPAVAGVTETHNSGTVIVGQNVNNLCFGCHQSPAKTANGTGADTDLDLTGKIPVKNNVTAPGYVPEYNGHVIGNMFLNSPHARFSGTITPNKLGKYDLTTNDKSQYASSFNGMICRSGNGVGSGSILKTYVNPSTGAAEIINTSADCSTAGGNWVASGGSAATAQGSCVTCHDVHQSVVPEVGAAEPMVRECTTCHVEQAASYPAVSAITNIRHPTGSGTPRQDEVAAPASPCEICHMPKATDGGFPSHLFRINVNPSYSTFPTSDEFLGNTKKVANTAPDGAFANAVWNDLDLSCGQCHGAGGSAHLIPKGMIATYAEGMHDAGAIPSDCQGCHSSQTIAHPAGANTPDQCADCHGTTRAGVAPTVEAACLGCHSSSGVALHQFTAAQIAPYADAIHAGGGAPSTDCSVCHTETPSALINHPNDPSLGTPSCTDCHASSATTSNRTAQKLASGPKLGVLPTAAQACNSCHGGSDGRSAAKSGVPFIAGNYLTRMAGAMHKNVGPKASMEVSAQGGNPTTPGTRVKVGATVEVKDTSTDENHNLSSITVSWGDNSSVTIDPGTSANHAYVTIGKKTITITATDKKGRKSRVSQKITVIKK